MNGKEFTYELLGSVEEVRQHIRSCEGRHVQQAIYSTFMRALTQVCFTCQRIRGIVEWEGNGSWIPSVPHGDKDAR